MELIMICTSYRSNMFFCKYVDYLMIPWREGVLVVEDYYGCSVVSCFCCHLCSMDSLCGGVLVMDVGYSKHAPSR